MRGALALVLVLAVACSAPGGKTASTTASARVSSSATPFPPSPSAPFTPRPMPTPSFPASTGGIVEYPVPRPASAQPDCGDFCEPSLGTMTLGPDGNIWFTDVGRGQVGRITPQGRVTQLMLPDLAGGSHTIVAGPDGNVWVLERGSAGGSHEWLVRITPGGVVTKFDAGDSSTATDSITTGPDGNLWFTDTLGNRIGRMTPDGGLTLFDAVGGPRGIATGPDGNIWFTASNWVGRITMSGDRKYYSVGNDPSIPLRDIVAGPDGEMWFSGYDTLRRISPITGEMSRVVLPKGSLIQDLVVGPDRNVWYTDTGLNAIVRVSSTGVSSFPLPRQGSYPQGIAVGADGRIWFTEGQGGLIGSIGVKVPVIGFDQRFLIFTGPAPRSVPIRSTGDAPLVITGVRVTGGDAALFAIAGDTCSGHTIAPNAGCAVSIAYQGGGPAGIQSAFLELADNGTASPQRISLVAQAPDCRLPVTVSAGPDAPPQPKFVAITAGQMTNVAGDGFQSSGSTVKTIAAPVLTGSNAGYYDRLAGRWLPVSGNVVSPDGSRYVYAVYDAATRDRIHIVDVATGRDRAVAVPPDMWSPIAFTARGVYLVKAYEGVGPGLWLLDPDTGVLKAVFTDKAVTTVSSTDAWLRSRNAADTLPPPPTMGEAGNTILRRDLGTGATTTWWYRPGSDLYVVAVAGGVTFVNVREADAMSVYAVSASGATKVDFPMTAAYYPFFNGFVADVSGVWIGSGDGIYLWTARTGAVLVSGFAATPAGTCA